MQTNELHYDLPSELIAQSPAQRRDASRLLVLERATGRIEHTTFAALAEKVPERSLLVLNDTRVVPARFDAVKEKMASDALASGSPQNNPVVPTANEIVALYAEVFG